MNNRRSLLLHENRWYYMPFLFIIVFLVIISIGIINMTYHVVLEDEIENRKADAVKVIEIIDDTLDTLDSLNTLLMRDKLIISVVSATDHTSMIRCILDLNKVKNNFSKLNSYLEEYAIYLMDQDIILTGKTVFLQPELYIDAIKAFWNMSWKEFRSFCQDSGNTNQMFPIMAGGVSFSTHIPETILYTVPFVDITSGRQAGRTLFYLSGQDIVELLQSANPDSKGFVQLIFGDSLIAQAGEFGELLSPEDQEQRYRQLNFNQGNVYVLSSESVNSDIRIVSGVTNAYVLRLCLKKICGILICIIVMILLIGIVIIRSIYINRKPLEKISKHINSPSDPVTIESALSNLKDRVTGLNSTLEEQNELLKIMVCKQLIHGFDFSENEMEQQLDYADIHLDHGDAPLRAVYIRIDENEDNFQELTSIQAIIQKEITNYPSVYYLSMESINLIALLYCENTNTGTLTNLYQNLKTKYHFVVHIYIGSPFTQLHHAQRSFRDAMKLMKTDTGEHFIHYWEPASYQDGFEYDQLQESRLLTQIERGNIKEAQAELQHIYQKNFREKNLSRFMQELLYYRLISTLTLIQSGLEDHDIQFTGSPGDLSPEEFFEKYDSAMVRICRRIEEKKQQEQQQSDQELIEYLNSNFTDGNISITAVALRYGYSESYTSTRLKKLLGTSFSSYIEKKRIEQAKEYLNKGKNSISEIGQMVGYSSASVFGRAFKRITGCTPSQYQDQLKEGRSNEEPVSK